MANEEALLEAMTPGQARALQAACDERMSRLIDDVPDEEKVQRFRDWVEDRSSHGYRTLSRIAGLPEDITVSPLDVMEQIIVEDGYDGVDRDLHNQLALRGTVRMGLDAQQRYDLPDEIPPAPNTSP